MKKLSKVLAFVLSSALTIGIAGSMSAEAKYYMDITMTPPEGDVLYELDCEKGDVSYRSTSGKGLYVYGFENFSYNNISIELKNGISASTVSEKYFSDIDFDATYSTADNSQIFKYDKYVSGDDPRTHESIENKYKQLSEICAQMYMDGFLEEATFMPILSYYYSEDLQPRIICQYLYGPNEEYFKDEVDDLQAFVDKYTDNGEVKLYEYGGSGGKYYMCIILNDTDLDTYDELADLRDEIAESYDYENVIIDYSRPEPIIYASSAEINLLDPYICDIDNSGEADISDATQILQAYAKSMAGIQNDTANDKMDVNGDGEINIDDVTYVLTYYAESCAGLR